MPRADWLDDVAKTLARARSRRDLLKGFVAAVGALTASTVATRAQGSYCVDLCRSRGLTGRELGECIADCERGSRCGNDRCDPETEYCATCATIHGPVEVCLPIGSVC